MSQKSRWVLPKVVNPPDKLCFLIEVPNESFHIAAFLGAIYELAKPYSWQNDPAHTALAVGAVWRDIFDTIKPRNCADFSSSHTGIDIEDCMQLRINPDDPCIIQTECGDGTWQNWYDPRGCIPGIVAQPPASGDLAPGACQTFHAFLQGDGLWKLPIKVGDNYSIKITNAKGGYSDGTILWYCPNGGLFILGGCGAPSVPSVSDPLPTAPHMRLVGTDGTTWYDAYNTTVALPGGTGDVEFQFQTNDVDITDNHGSVTFDVEVCNKNVPGWTHTFDFFGTTSQHGWFITNDANGTLIWNVGGYWQSSNVLGNLGDGSGIVAAPVVGAFQVTAVQTTYGANAASTVRNIIYSSGGSVVHSTPMTNAAGPSVVTNDTWAGVVDEISVQLGADAPGKDCDLSKVVISGLGADPFVGY